MNKLNTTTEFENISNKGSKAGSEVSSLLHLSSISLNPLDIEYIEWNQSLQSSAKIVTRVRTKNNIFVLESNSSHYEADVELLKKATRRS